MKDFPISELRIVKLYFASKRLGGERQLGQSPAIHMCHFSQVDKLVEASIELHHGAGNPHTGETLDNLWQIDILELHLDTRSYWWCVPGLRQNDDPNGAQLNQLKYIKKTRVWAHPELLAQEAEYEERED